MTTATARPGAPARTYRYAGQTSAVLLVAFTGSAAYTLYVTLAGLPRTASPPPPPSPGPITPSGSLRRSPSAATGAARGWRSPCCCRCLLTVSVLVYPAAFVPELQTPIGWLENDGYVSLLAVALYLTVQRLRRVSLVP